VKAGIRKPGACPTTRHGAIATLGSIVLVLTAADAAAVPTVSAAAVDAVLVLEVLDADTGAPVEGATVHAGPGNLDNTDADGRVEWDITDRDVQRYRIDADGYYDREFRWRMPNDVDPEAGERIRAVAKLAPIKDIELVLKTQVQVGLGSLPYWGKKTVRFDGKEKEVDGAEVIFTVNYESLKLRSLIERTIPLEISGDGIRPYSKQVRIDSLMQMIDWYASEQVRQIPAIVVVEPETADSSGHIDLGVRVVDSLSNAPVSGVPRVGIRGVGTKSQRAGTVEFRVDEPTLRQLKRRGLAELEIRVSAPGYKGPVEQRADIDSLLRKIWNGDARHVLQVKLEREATAPAIAVTATPSARTIVSGDAVAVQYTVSNTGDSPLDRVALDDDRCSPPNFIAGDTNGDGILDPGEGIAASECPGGMMPIPFVRGYPVDRAVKIFVDAGLGRPWLSYTEREDVEDGEVISQIPEPGECTQPGSASGLIVAMNPPPDFSDDPVPFQVDFDCGEAFEIEAGAEPSKVCHLIVRGWVYNDERVNVNVTVPSGSGLDVWPRQDSAWPPNMYNPGVADVESKRRYEFALFFNASATATPGIVPVQIAVSQNGVGRETLDVDVAILAPGMVPSRGPGIRPPPEVATGSGSFCVWRHKSFGEPPACFDFNIAECGTAAYDGNPNYERVAANMTKLQASARMSQLSRYGDDEYGCLDQIAAAGEADGTRACPDGSRVPADQPCPDGRDAPPVVCPDGTTIRPGEQCPPRPDTRTCPNGGEVPADEPCPEDEPVEPDTRTCPDGSEVPVDEPCPDDPPADGQLDCSPYGPRAELYWDAGAGEHLCRCEPGYAFHATTDRCVAAGDVNQCLDYPGTFPSGDHCVCADPDHYWSASAGGCVAQSDLPSDELADCSMYPGTLPVTDGPTGGYACACPPMTRWSDALGRCVTAAEEEIADADCSHRPGTIPEIDYFENRVVCRCPDMKQQWDSDNGRCVDPDAVAGTGTGSGTSGVGDDPDPPPPTDVQPGQCNDTTRHGSDQAVRVQVDIAGVQSLSLIYDTETVKDRVRAFIDGAAVMDSGCVGTRGDATQALNVPPGAQTLEVDVYPNCEGTTGTSWSFTVDCGGN